MYVRIAVSWPFAQLKGFSKQLVKWRLHFKCVHVDKFLLDPHHGAG